jgi:hypothetical protein
MHPKGLFAYPVAGAAPTVSGKLEYDATSNLFKGGFGTSADILCGKGGSLNNNCWLSVKDSAGAVLPAWWFDGSNDMHFGVQSAPTSGNGILSLYAKGTKILNLIGGTAITPILRPETDGVVWLGELERRYAAVHAGQLNAYSIGAVKAFVAIESADNTGFVSVWGPSTVAGGGYYLYLPPAQGAAGSVLQNNGSGVLSWASSALPAGTTSYTLRYNGTAWVASGALLNNGTDIDAPSGGFIARGSIPTVTGYGVSFGYNGVQSWNAIPLLLNPLGYDVLIGTTDYDGTPPVGRLVVKGSTADGTTNIFVGRDSAEANVARLDTDGNLTLSGTVTATDIIAPVARVVADVHLTGKSATISTTNLLASAAEGLYRVTYYIHVTTAGAAGSLAFTGGYTCNGAAETNGNGYAVTELDEGYRQESFVCRVDDSTAITYAVALSGGSGVSYWLDVILEKLN